MPGAAPRSFFLAKNIISSMAPNSQNFVNFGENLARRAALNKPSLCLGSCNDFGANKTQFKHP